MAKLNDDEIRDLIASLYQAVAAIVIPIEHPTSDGDKYDETLLDILADPDEIPLAEAQEKLRAIQAFYWAKTEPNVTASAGAAVAGLSDKEVRE